MKSGKHINVLLVEPGTDEVERLKEAFGDLKGATLSLTQVTLLQEALACLKQDTFDIVILDLQLPDSQGVASFERIHKESPSTPVLVLAGPDNEALAVQAVEQGAQDYLVKKELEPPLVTRSIRYAMERSRLQQALAATRQKEQQQREFDDIDRLSRPPGTAVTTRIYAGSPLREAAPAQFASLVERYAEFLKLALEETLFETEQHDSENLRVLADELGFLRAKPRDVIEIHSTALKSLVEDVPWQKAQAYLQEGRLRVLELMGYLTSYYRNHYPARPRKEPAP